MGRYVAKQTVKKIAAQDKNICHAKVLIMGMTFKENVSDIRNTKVADIINELESYKVIVDVVDPYAVPKEVHEEYGVTISEKPNGKYDAIIVAVNHKQYIDLDEKYFKSLSNNKGILIDVKGIFKDKIHDLIYWSL
jgi:UDP-N-acetyl-D-galactosamine dehydrogenase